MIHQSKRIKSQQAKIRWALYSTSEQSEMEIRETISSTIAYKIIKYLGINQWDETLVQMKSKKSVNFSGQHIHQTFEN